MKILDCNLAALILFAALTGCQYKGTLRCFDRADADFKGDESLFAKLVADKDTMPLKEVSEIAQKKQRLSVMRSALWSTNRIQVCWEDLSWKDEDELKREIVRQGIEETWEEALHIDDSRNVKFVGWTKCSEGNNEHIKIVVEDTGPGVTGLGSNLAKYGKMYLNFTFKNWSPTCEESENGTARHEYCIRNTAVHEFGHALGITHEQNRVDLERTVESKGHTCEETKKQGTVGDTNVGIWDISSVMNYCNPDWNNLGELSILDKIGIKMMYYPDLFNGIYCAPSETFEKTILQSNTSK